MDDLVQFLRARLDEDEAAIEAPETWTEFDESTQGTRRVDVDHSFERVVACTRAWRAVHIARHDPARVLAEVDAGRMAIEHYERVVAHSRGDDAYVLAVGAVEVQLKVRALPYANHSAYKPEWRP